MVHTIDDTEVVVKLLDTIPPEYTSQDILVRGDVGEEALELFFTNKKKCGGGEIVDIRKKSDIEAIITFKDPAGMYESLILLCKLVWTLSPV